MIYLYYGKAQIIDYSLFNGESTEAFKLMKLPSLHADFFGPLDLYIEEVKLNEAEAIDGVIQFEFAMDIIQEKNLIFQIIQRSNPKNKSNISMVLQSLVVSSILDNHNTGFNMMNHLLGKSGLKLILI